MPAIPIVVGALAVSAGAAGTAALIAGTVTLATVAAGAALLGGVAMIAGTLKGGTEGAKWTSDGGMLATVGSLGMSVFGTGAAEVAATDAVPKTDLTATNVNPGAPASDLATGGAGAVPNVTAANPGGALSDAQIMGSSGNTTAFSGNPLNIGTTPATTTAQSLAPVVDATGTAVTTQTGTASDAAARAAATNTIPTTAQPGAGYNWDPTTSKWLPPSSSLTSNNNMMTLLGNSMNGYSQGQNTQAQIDALKALQTQRIQADQARVAASQYNPLLTASNK